MKRWRLLLVLTALSAACRGTDSDADRQGTTAAEPECVREGYPCTLGEVEPAVMAREDSLAEVVAGHLVGGMPEADLEALLDGTPGMVTAAADSDAVRFRLEGGRPVWVALRTPGFRGGAGAATSARPPRPGPAPATETAVEVVGKGAPASIEKRALVLSPMKRDENFGPWDEGAWVRDKLLETRGYEHGVEYFENDEVMISHFTGWDSYDLVLVATHGMRACRGWPNEHCWVGLATGIPGCRTSAELRVRGLSRGFTVMPFVPPPLDPNAVIDFPGQLSEPAGANVAPDTESSWGCMLESDFFAIHYPTGLDKTIVVLNACELAQGPEMAFNLTGTNSAVFGWTVTVDSPVASIFGKSLIGRLAEEGITTNEFYLSRGTSFSVLQQLQYSERSANSWSRNLVMYPSDAALRIREVVWLLDPETREELADGTVLEVLGTPDDGDADTLRLLFQVDGIAPEDDPSEYELFLDVAETPLSGGSPRWSGIPIDERFSEADVKNGVARKLVDVPLGLDLRADGLYALKPGVQLPEGGESRWLYEDMRVTGWELQIMTGPHAGVYRGSDATGRGGLRYFEDSPANVVARAAELGTGVQTFSFVTEEDADKQFLVTLKMHDTGAVRGVTGPGDYRIPTGLDVVPEVDRLMAGDFADERCSVHRSYQAGDGSVTPDGPLPPPATLRVAQLTRGHVSAKLEGTLWTADPCVPEYISVPVRLEFRARRCLLEAGLSGDRCYPIPDDADLESVDEDDPGSDDEGGNEGGEGPSGGPPGPESGSAAGGGTTFENIEVLVEFGAAHNAGLPSALSSAPQQALAIRRLGRYDITASDFALSIDLASLPDRCVPGGAAGPESPLGGAVQGTLMVAADASAGQLALTFVPSEGPLSGSTIRITAEGLDFNPYGAAPGATGYRVHGGDLDITAAAGVASDPVGCADSVDLGFLIQEPQ